MARPHVAFSKAFSYPRLSPFRTLTFRILSSLRSRHHNVVLKILPLALVYDLCSNYIKYEVLGDLVSDIRYWKNTVCSVSIPNLLFCDAGFRSRGLHRDDANS